MFLFLTLKLLKMEFSLLPLKDGAIKERMLDQIVYFNVFKL